MILSLLFAAFLSLLLSILLGGLTTFFIKFLLALAFIPFLLYFKLQSKQESGSFVIQSGPVILTIDFVSSLFYGWFSVQISSWSFSQLGIEMDSFFPLFLMVGIIWTDARSMMRERLRMKSYKPESFIYDEKETYNLDEVQQKKKSINNMLSEHANSRITSMIGKVAGTIIGITSLLR